MISCTEIINLVSHDDESSELCWDQKLPAEYASESVIESGTVLASQLLTKKKEPQDRPKKVTQVL